MSPTPVRLNAGLTQTVLLLDEVLVASPTPVRLGAGLIAIFCHAAGFFAGAPTPVRLITGLNITGKDTIGQYGYLS